MENKICYVCKRERSISEFNKDKSTKDGLAIKCKFCRSEIRLKNRAKRTAYNKTHREETRNYRLRRKYGIDTETRNEIIKEQKGKCPICDKFFNLIDPRDVHMDHNHKSNTLRGILCKDCNLLIGFAKEDIKILNKAIIYLKFWNKNC